MIKKTNRLRLSPEVGDIVVSLGDRLIQEGFEKGWKQGLEEGLEQGLEKARRQGLKEDLDKGLQKGLETGFSHAREQERVIVQRMLGQGATDDFILSVTELSGKELITIKHAINAQNTD